MLGVTNLTNNILNSFPINIPDVYKTQITIRALLLNCITNHYADFYKKVSPIFKIEFSWSKKDSRLPTIGVLPIEFPGKSLITNSYSRRLLLIEIDILTSMAFNLNLTDLVNIYESQFPLLQQYEDETFYDQSGNIIFTSNKGLTGIGVDRTVWNEIQGFSSGKTYEHTITKSELYHGRKVTYYAPFDKCDRVEDYKVAWAHFERVFSEKSSHD